MNVLEIKNVCKKYSNNSKKVNTTALKNINLTLRNNEFIGIMGTSGSGKTTLLNVASGIDSCDEGEINILDNNISEMDRNELSLFRRSNIGMVFQDFNLLNSLSVKENIMVPLLLDKKYELLEEGIVNKLANMMDISGILDRYPYEISGGQQQRAAICRAIINNPKIIFADEPTGNLDSRSSKKVLSYFELLHNEYNANILMVTHDPFSASYCDKVVFLQDGSIINEIRKQGDKVKFLNSILEIVQDFDTVRIKEDIDD
ncbi:ABC transporter ATP-binding protein [Pseudobacteroides cellulosolvens]|uniref:Phosphonate-transporting ATPase n=2 Tax=Pseudobacteroides cellulosolvens TaxID=35825 RepID=A0A0L6JLB1_9FIRM|nr:ABC transporter ATP-binding protein [Pseudobacteroides cellulosolvens]KNY26172.1 Phosphonate-transporting ATPase [Pseudobacteroides cellulosolvens ATCC 35603 = DSM 2933]